MSYRYTSSVGADTGETPPAATDVCVCVTVQCESVHKANCTQDLSLMSNTEPLTVHEGVDCFRVSADSDPFGNSID